MAETPKPQAAAGMAVQKLYEVRADQSYDVTHKWRLASPLVAIRTWTGLGVLESGPKAHELPADSLVIIPSTQIRRFFCADRTWHFWWLEFRPLAGIPLPTQAVSEVEVSSIERASLRACFADLRRNGPCYMARASARFVFLLHHWAAETAGESAPRTQHQEAMQRVVELMHARTAEPLALAEMASVTGLSERRFRQVFAQLTGKAPKRFHDELRLRKAADHLRFQAGNVSETAYAFGFSSPFHFSKAFRKLFGMPPRDYCGRSLEPGQRLGG